MIFFTRSTRLLVRTWVGIFLTALGISAHPTAGAEFKLSSVFGHHMVVQRGQPIAVWGEAPPATEVQVRLGSRSGAVRSGTNGQWEVLLDPLTPVGPYTLVASAGGKTLTFTNVLCGDVWLCSGQSNMQMPVKEVDPAEQRTAHLELPHLRLCSVAREPAAKPVAFGKVEWRPYTPGAAQNFSAVATFFAHHLLKAPGFSGIPLGIVDCSFGGTTCEAWIPAPQLTNFAPTDLHDSFLGFKPAQHYNGMIAPLGHMSFKGVLWYQGESNSAHPETYPALLATMIACWREQFRQPELPFLLIQLPEYANLWEGFYWPWIREMQARAAQSIPNTALVVALQTTDGFNLHPKEKLEIGRRAALVARRFVYGEQIVASGPVFQKATVQGPHVRVNFDTAGEGLATTAGEQVTGFALAGADGEYYFAEAKIDGDSVVVRSDQVREPRTVRYAWGAMPQGSLINKSGLPVAPFRTDQFSYSNVEVQPQRITRRVATSAYEIVIDANGMPASLVVHGAQFLSNEPGGAGGASIPGFWGPKALSSIRETGPCRLTCSDEEVTLQMVFQEKSMDWTLTNRGKDPISFQIALSPLVQTPALITDGKVVVSRGDVTLSLEGFETLTNTPTGPRLISQVKAASMKKFTLK